MLTIIYDITAAEQTHGQLFEILESIQDAFYAVDAEWRFVYVNKRAEQLWRKSREALLGKQLWEIFPEVVETSLFNRVAQAMRERKAVHFDAVSPVLGSWVSAHLYPLADGGLSVYFRQIPEPERAEESLPGDTQSSRGRQAAGKRRGKRK